MNRRDFLTGAGALALAPPCFSLSEAIAAPMTFGTCVLNPPILDKPKKPEKAASLNRILAEASSGARPSFGMTRIDGYVTEKNDVILWGRNEPGHKELIFDDLVVALSSIRGKHGRGTPGVSLDSVKGNIGATPARAEYENKSSDAFRALKMTRDRHADMENFKRVCDQFPAYARITALPDYSQIAKDLLDADYLMKKVTLGLHRLKLKDPFPDPHTIKAKLYTKIQNGTASQSEKDAAENNRNSGSGRRWFVPGRMSYVRDENSVFIDCVQILLKIETWKLGTFDPDTKLATAIKDPIAEDFVCSWTNRMKETIQAEPLFRRMEDIFRMFALARILDRVTGSWGASDIRYLSNQRVFDDYVIPVVSVPDQYPRLTRQIEWSSNKGPRWTHACGGVTVRYQNTAHTKEIVTAVDRYDIHLAGEKALESMRSCNGKSCWKVE
jgi:hypothetical protein